ncbi:lipopolysaccharide biosynthesis protein [Cereibacter sphaeroides]|nr:lipopolysaccharide biosynthesis protein [Cereibacter sphaeroides]
MRRGTTLPNGSQPRPTWLSFSKSMPRRRRAGWREAVPGKKMIRNILLNTLWIYALQASTAIVPLLTVPFATRIIGLDGIAFFGTAVAIGSVASVVSEYSFDLSGIKDAARAQSSRAAKNVVIVQRLYAQWSIFLVLVALAVLFTLLPLGISTGGWSLAFAAMLVTVSNVAFPFWVSQSLGLERRYTAHFALARLLSLPLVFLALEKWPTGFYYVVALYLPLALSLGLLLVRSLGRDLMLEPYRVRPLLSVLATSFDVFLSRLFVALYQNGGLLALGMVATPEAVGLFALADRVRKASLFLLTPISRALYPVACSLANDPAERSGAAFRLVFLAYLGAGALITAGLFSFSSQIAAFFTDEDPTTLAAMVKVFAFFPLVSSGTIVLGQNVLLARGHVSAYTQSVIGAFIFYAMMVFPLAFFAQALGVSIAFLSAEVTLAAAFLLLSWRVRSLPRAEEMEVTPVEQPR